MEKEYYTEEEVNKIMYSYIRETAKELKIDTFENKAPTKDISYV